MIVRLFNTAWVRIKLSVQSWNNDIGNIKKESFVVPEEKYFIYIAANFNVLFIFFFFFTYFFFYLETRNFEQYPRLDVCQRIRTINGRRP